MEIPSHEMRAPYDLYVKAWSPVSATERLDLLTECMAADCDYSDNVSYTQGPSGLAAVMENFQRKTPGGYFIVDEFFVQHNRALIHWRAMDGAHAVRFGHRRRHLQ